MFTCPTGPIPVTRRGRALLENPVLNKGTAFTEAERTAFRLRGLLPPHVDSLEDQVERSYAEFKHKNEDLERHIFLRQLQDENETLFYRLLFDHIEEMTPVVYTPVVGRACQRFGHIFRRPRGLYISYPNRDQIDVIMSNVDRDVDVIVVTDGERILGLGDQGAGGMGIPIGKLSLYSLCGGIHPRRTLPILLDLGTDNEERLADPRYQGWRHERIRGPEYDEFVENFVQAVMHRFPHVLLQWEDFASTNAEPLLRRYQNRLCTFNDDIQGTAAVILGTILSAVNAKKERLVDQVFLSVGAGSAGFGAFELLMRALINKGLTEAEARSRVFVTDSKGLIFEGREGITPMKKTMQQLASFGEWAGPDGRVPTEEVVRRAKPTVMIGATGSPNTFSEALVRPMLEFTERPVIMPLSNPTSRAEATPAEILEWTDGRALIASGSPFDPVEVDGVVHHIAQCNNIYIFPAMGLGVCAVNARRVSEKMFIACAEALAKESPALAGLDRPLLPPLPSIREVSKRTAKAIALAAQADGTADMVSEDEVVARIECKMWEPEYARYRPV
jgi:malate dehydrogenase (oxaloacetate-decarboxylating)